MSFPGSLPWSLRLGPDLEFGLSLLHELFEFLKDDLTGDRVPGFDAFLDLASQGLATLLHLGVQPERLSNDIDLISTAAAGNGLMDDWLKIQRKVNAHQSPPKK